ncbi:uncharacterized protein SAZU_3689 [Streptomyces azureus]|uniref:Uncharacterized protein n=1 Tax=Streptomyces azureus TaxID=146537 RepID=A0A0K8PN30_STRAJ|nr:uncharacterized protein SAZU_3689 [Streptomyces azureus]
MAPRPAYREPGWGLADRVTGRAWARPPFLWTGARAWGGVTDRLMGRPRVAADREQGSGLAARVAGRLRAAPCARGPGPAQWTRRRVSPALAVGLAGADGPGRGRGPGEVGAQAGAGLSASPVVRGEGSALGAVPRFRGPGPAQWTRRRGPPALAVGLDGVGRREPWTALGWAA